MTAAIAPKEPIGERVLQHIKNGSARAQRAEASTAIANGGRWLAPMVSGVVSRGHVGLRAVSIAGRVATHRSRAGMQEPSWSRREAREVRRGSDGIIR